MYHTTTSMSCSRRAFLRQTALAGAGLLLGRSSMLSPQAHAAPTMLTPADARPQLPYGAMTGDITNDRIIVWSKVDRPARMIVEYATTEAFRHAKRMIGPAALEDSDFTARLELRNLPPGQQIFYKVLFQDLHDITVMSEPVYGTFRTPSALYEGKPRSVSFVFSGDEAGQGWGINLDWGGVPNV
jgi:alkaline phosphatase D